MFKRFATNIITTLQHYHEAWRKLIIVFEMSENEIGKLKHKTRESSSWQFLNILVEICCFK